MSQEEREWLEWLKRVEDGVITQPLGKHSRVLRQRGAFADCLVANPVASAWGNLARRDPSEAVRIYHEGYRLGPYTGTFGLAGNRNFLFGSDSMPGDVLLALCVTP